MGLLHFCWTGKRTIGVHIIQLVCDSAMLGNETALWSLIVEQCLYTVLTENLQSIIPILQLDLLGSLSYIRIPKELYQAFVKSPSSSYE